MELMVLTSSVKWWEVNMLRHIVQIDFSVILGCFTSQRRAIMAIKEQFPNAVMSSFKPTVFLDDHDTRIEVVSMQENNKLNGGY